MHTPVLAQARGDGCLGLWGWMRFRQRGEAECRSSRCDGFNLPARYEVRAGLPEHR
jgi:hypothetical protein